MAHARSLVLIRHAVAHERGDKWPDDTKRPLTHEGAARMRLVARGLLSLRLRFDLVLTSPLTRAVSTAEIVAHGVHAKGELVTLPLLAPGGSPARVAEALAAFPKAHSIALVGHEPDLGELAAWLVGARHPLPFKKGGACRITFAEWPPAAKQGTLVWFATPKMLRSVD